ncbi:hypothetical protein [Pseudonocardia lacus]|uniref:hypothetical protein n=1 Tax=Pseudonocardia lacus TaxID=2835865 RepID=UPI001BDBB31D|nr:hypothetical protein [Pseudonocardia lacus]
MRTVCGLARAVQVLVSRGRGAPGAVAAVSPLTGGRRPLLTDRIGEQRRGGAKLDQVDGTTCGSAVLVALSAWADPAEVAHLEGESGAVAAGAGAGVAAGFGARWDARQKQVHAESTKLWPQALGTSPWGMTRWLREHAPAAGPYRVRLVDDASAADVAAAVAEVEAALSTGRPVPLLVGAFVPRHYCMALSRQDDGAWRVYEPTSGQVRAVDPALIGRRALRPLLGFDHLHALLLPS